MPKKIITQDELRSLVDYDLETGVLRWKRRPESMFATLNGAAVWNAKFPGKVLGCFTKDARGKTTIFGSAYYLSHLAWLYVHGEFPPHGLYHKNGDHSDNRISNLELDISNRKEEITHGELLQALRYNPETGSFILAVRRRNSYANKKEAGTINTIGYRVLTLYGKQYKAHRIAWFYVYGIWPSRDIDHINGNRADNRLCNLRLATPAENHQNRGFDCRNTTGYTGVFKVGTRNLWTAAISVNNRRLNLGTFESPELAYQAYLEAKRKHHTFNPTPRYCQIAKSAETTPCPPSPFCS